MAESGWRCCIAGAVRRTGKNRARQYSGFNSDAAAAVTLVYLRHVPTSAGGREKFWWNHYQDHIKILAVVASKSGKQQFMPVIYPVTGTFTPRQAEEHQLLHQQMNLLSGAPTSDMTKLNFNDQDDFRTFVFENFNDHNFFHMSPGITV